MIALRSIAEVFEAAAHSRLLPNANGDYVVTVHPSVVATLVAMRAKAEWRAKYRQERIRRRRLAGSIDHAFAVKLQREAMKSILIGELN